MAEGTKLEIVSPERLVISETVKSVVVPGADGYFTVLGEHAPLMTTLKPGFITVEDNAGVSHVYYVRGGFAVQQLTRFLAIFSAVSASFFVFYIIPAQFWAVQADPWPEDVLKRSYFTSGLCGEGTDRPCPDPALPIPSRHSGYVNVDGQFVLPDGVQMPTVVPHERSE